MYCVNVGVGQYCNCGFWYYWYINCYYIIFFNVQFEQGIGEVVDVVVQFFIVDMFVLVGVVVFLDDGGTIVVFLQMVVKVVCCQIQCVVFVLFNGYIIGGKGGVFYFLVRFDLVKNFFLFVLEGIRYVNRLLIYCFVLLRVYQVMVCDVGRNGVFVNLVYVFVFFVGC